MSEDQYVVSAFLWWAGATITGCYRKPSLMLQRFWNPSASRRAVDLWRSHHWTVRITCALMAIGSLAVAFLMRPGPETWQEAFTLLGIAVVAVRLAAWLDTDPSDVPDIHDKIVRVFRPAVLAAYAVRVLYPLF